MNSKCDGIGKEIAQGKTTDNAVHIGGFLMHYKQLFKSQRDGFCSFTANGQLKGDLYTAVDIASG